MDVTPQYLLRWRGQISGPFSRDVILQKLDEHSIGMWHEIQSDGEWLTVEGFFERERKGKVRVAQGAATEKPPPLPTAIDINAPTPSSAASRVQRAFAARKMRPKRMKWFAAFGLGLGFFGAHNFYAGYWGTALAQVLLTIVTCALDFGIFAAWLWAMLEVLLIHTDRRGVRMI